MKNSYRTIKIEEIIIGFTLLVFAGIFFSAKQYVFSFLSLCLLLILLKLDYLKKLIYNPNLGLEAEFDIPNENIERDIKENNEKVNKKTFGSFKQIEERVVKDVYKKIGGEMKREIHFVYGMPDKPEFAYTPDAIIQTENALIFLEVKYVLKPEFTKRIINNTIQYLKLVLDKFSPSAGKKLVIKLILASAHELDLSSINIPKGIDLEFYKL